MAKYLDGTGLAYLWGKISAVFAKKADIPKYVICTLSEYEGMASHYISTDYIVVDENTSLLKIMKGDTQKWPVPYEKQYLTFEALETGTFTFTYNKHNSSSSYIEYSTDGINWNRLSDTSGSDSTCSITTPPLFVGDKVYWRGSNVKIGNSTAATSSTFSSTGKFRVSGNLSSLLDGSNIVTSIAHNTSEYRLAYLFYQTNVVDASNLILPAFVKKQWDSNREIYWGLFHSCADLVFAPNLPVTAATNGCYYAMFYNCSSLIKAPELNLTSLEYRCCRSMFQNCTSLVDIPEELPLKTLASECYYSMFSGCTNITKAPVLPALTLHQQCYFYMFSGCTSLIYIKAMFTTTPGGEYTLGWVNNVAASGTFVKNSVATWNVAGNHGIPTGWTIETANE